MNRDQNIFFDEEPDASPLGPWILGAAATILIATLLATLGRTDAPNNDLTVQELPPISTTSMIAEDPATSAPSDDPDLLLELLVPGFNRTLYFATFLDDGFRTTSWRRGSSPQSADLALGFPLWIGSDASGEHVAATTENVGGQTVVWVGTASSLSPEFVAGPSAEVAFHATEPGHFLLAEPTADGTLVRRFRIHENRVEEIDGRRIDGLLRAPHWSTEGMFFLEAVASLPQLLWIQPDETEVRITGFVLATAGQPFLLECRDDACTDNRLARPLERALVEVPPATRSLSPSLTFAVVDSLFEAQLLDLRTQVALPLSDSIGGTHAWSADDQWFAYVSAIEVYRRGPLTRLVLVDTTTGTSISTSIASDQLPVPDIIWIGD